MPFRARIHPASLARRQAMRPLRTTLRGPALRTVSASAVVTYTTCADSIPGPSTWRATTIGVRCSSTSSRPFRHSIAQPPSTLQSISDFFSFSKQKPSRVNLSNARDEFLRTARKGDIEKMKTAYDIVLDAIQSRHGQTSGNQPETSELLGPEDLAAGLDALSTSEYPLQALSFLTAMYNDVGQIFGFKRNVGHHSALALGLCRAGRVGEAMAFLQSLDSEDIDWTELLRLTSEDVPEMVPEVFEIVRKSKVTGSEDWEIYLGFLRKEIEQHRCADGTYDFWVNTMRKERAGLDQGLDVEMARTYVILERYEQAEEILQRWSPDKLGGDLSENGWNAWIELALAQYKYDEAIRLCHRMRKFDYDIPSRTLVFLANRELQKGADVKQAVDIAERQAQSQMDSKGWAKLIDLQTDLPFNKPFTTYQVAKMRGTEVDATLASAVIMPLCRASMAEGRSLDDALEAYDDLLRYDVDLYSLSSNRLLGAIIYSLLSACAAVSLPRSTTALRLLQDAGEYGVTLPDDTIHPIFTLIQACPDHVTAFHIYRQYAAIHTLTKDDYDRVINAFLTVQPASGDFILPPADLFLELVKAMHRGGLSPGMHVLTSLVSRYGFLASQRKGISEDTWASRKAVLYSAIHDLHTRIKLDPMVTIDIPFLNALMDAYNRVGASSAALLIWNDLVDRRARTDPVVAAEQYPYSVAIGLDICGYGGMPKRADRIWGWARRHGFADTTRSWNGFVENLCRMGEYGRAADIVCQEMRNPTSTNEGCIIPPATIETVKVLLKFSWRIGNVSQRDELIQRLRVTYPEYWEEVRARLGSRWAEESAVGPVQ